MTPEVFDALKSIAASHRAMHAARIDRTLRIILSVLAFYGACVAIRLSGQMSPWPSWMSWFLAVVILILAAFVWRDFVTSARASAVNQGLAEKAENQLLWISGIQPPYQHPRQKGWIVETSIVLVAAVASGTAILANEIASAANGITKPQGVTMNIDLAGLVIAAVVPFLSLWVAHSFSAAADLKQDARRILVKIRRDLQDYRNAYLAFREDMERKDSNAATASKARIQDVVAEIDGDCMELGLLFDKRANPVGSRLSELAHTVELIKQDSVPTHADSDLHLRKYMETISQEMRPLWALLNERSFTKRLLGRL